jgi:hypothetical protein
MVRSNVEIKSNLPLFEMKASEDFPDYLLVRCPREDCPSHTKDGTKPFLVHKRTWQRPRKSQNVRGELVVVYGRVCPYCHKVSRPPTRRLQL